MISGPQLAMARNQMSRMLTDTCEHFAKTDGVDESYAKSEEYESQGELPCLIYNAQARGIGTEIDTVGETTADVGSYVFRFHWDENVTVGDKLVVNDTEFLVTSDSDNDTNRFILQVGASRIRGDKF